MGPQHLKESGKLQKTEARKRRREEILLPFTSRSENKIWLIISDEDDAFSYDNSCTHTDGKFLPAKT